MALTKVIDGEEMRWRFPSDGDFELLCAYSEALDNFPESPLAPLWRRYIKYLRWIDGQDID